MQYLSRRRSFFIALTQYFLIFTPFDICVARKLRAHLLTQILEPVRNRLSLAIGGIRQAGYRSEGYKRIVSVSPTRSLSTGSVELLRSGRRRRTYQQREESDSRGSAMECCRKKMMAGYWIACSFIFRKKTDRKSIAFSEKTPKYFFLAQD